MQNAIKAIAPFSAAELEALVAADGAVYEVWMIRARVELEVAQVLGDPAIVQLAALNLARVASAASERAPERAQEVA